ncbi:MAG: transglutaminase family protein [Nitrospirae bacterium]|nr:transglutaminase family protein [Nitrospirota bacterium]
MTPAVNLDAYLSGTFYIDTDHPQVRAFAMDTVAGIQSVSERAVKLFYAVRDSIRYDPYSLRPNPECFKASTVLEAGASFCVPKAVLLAAAARVVGIPARLGFADVRNHLATKKLLDRLGSDLFIFHGFTELFLADRWVKATPTFNLALCEKFGVKALDFDGAHDSLFHAFDKEGKKFMEYVRYRGSYADVPLDEMFAEFQRAYPGFAERFLAQQGAARDFDFEKEIDR